MHWGIACWLLIFFGTSERERHPPGIRTGRRHQSDRLLFRIAVQLEPIPFALYRVFDAVVAIASSRLALTRFSWSAGDFLVFRKSKVSKSPGPTAKNVSPSTADDTYGYIKEVLPKGSLFVQTMRQRTDVARWWHGFAQVVHIGTVLEKAFQEAERIVRDTKL